MKENIKHHSTKRREDFLSRVFDDRDNTNTKSDEGKSSRDFTEQDRRFREYMSSVASKNLGVNKERKSSEEFRMSKETFFDYAFMGRALELGITGLPPSEHFMKMDGIELGRAAGSHMLAEKIPDKTEKNETKSRMENLGTYEISDSGLISVIGSDGSLYLGPANPRSLQALQELGYRESRTGRVIPLTRNERFVNPRDDRAWRELLANQ